ncbi:hypothetical protein HN832_04340 [archaeon]|jgi:hypothetical protein|nr:hypothetical protein [archaeon]MBT4373376.1 hypothetical protein [archaeon]MBT4531824.1 hypothetical protein [archaeon]MBT7001491.1 hypothetical protein [archaeon]MBT7282617.1 hypothetical protein [archaeon]
MENDVTPSCLYAMKVQASRLPGYRDPAIICQFKDYLFDPIRKKYLTYTLCVACEEIKAGHNSPDLVTNLNKMLECEDRAEKD